MKDAKYMRLVGLARAVADAGDEFYVSPGSAMGKAIAALRAELVVPDDVASTPTPEQARDWLLAMTRVMEYDADRKRTLERLRDMEAHAKRIDAKNARIKAEREEYKGSLRDALDSALWALKYVEKTVEAHAPAGGDQFFRVREAIRKAEEARR